MLKFKNLKYNFKGEEQILRILFKLLMIKFLKIQTLTSLVRKYLYINSHSIFFYTDGGAPYPSKALQRF